MATPKKKAVVSKKEEKLPAHLKGRMDDDMRGSENVGGDDLTIPRIELVQSLSKCRKKNDPNFIVGCQEGDLYNNVTRQLYGPSITVVPIFYRKEWLLWRDQDLGGGFAGSHDSPEIAESERLKQENPEQWEVTETAQQFVLVLHNDAAPEQAVISMAKSKLRVSKDWNTLIRIGGGPRFSRMYSFTGVEAQNNQGQDFHSVKVKSLGFASAEAFESAERTYELVSKGNVRIDDDFDDAGGDVVAEM